MLRTNLNEMLIFMAVVDGASFVAGGQAMGLTRSAAGKAVARLEDSLGVRLLNRTTRTLSLTDEAARCMTRGWRSSPQWTTPKAASASPPGYRAVYCGLRCPMRSGARCCCRC